MPPQDEIVLNGHALQCRITTEDPLNKFIPDYGRIAAYRGAMGFGIRLDGGTAYSGAVVTRHYDSLLEKVTAWAPSAQEGIDRMIRALREFRIRGVATNLLFLESLLGHPKFRACEYTTRFIDEHTELFEFKARRDRASRLLNYIADIMVNGHPEVLGRARPPADARVPSAPAVPKQDPPSGARARLESLGAEGLARWILAQPHVLLTDTTMRDAHQSLLATRMRSYDMLPAARAYAHTLPQLFSVECWGGATFDVAFRFLQEDPWDRLRELRQRMPNILLQMLLRGANAVGYTSYPDNVVRDFTLRAAETGIDLFRIFDSLNWCENMRVSIDAVLSRQDLEAAICFTGNILDLSAEICLGICAPGARAQSTTQAHSRLKDMAGLLTRRARLLGPALKQETGCRCISHPRHLGRVVRPFWRPPRRRGYCGWRKFDALSARLRSVSGAS